MNANAANETWNIEITDTFSGEANYSWVRRYKIELPQGASRLQIMRAAKKVAGYSAVRGTTEYFGDAFVFRPAGACVVMFVS